MHRYIFRRVLFIIPTVLGVSLLLFAVMSITPGDPGRAILGANTPQADIDAYNEEIGYNLPFFQKYLNYVKNMIIHQDFGVSYYTKQSVFNEILPRFSLTIKLALLGVALSAIIGIPMGIDAAINQYSLRDTVPSLLAFLISSVPVFVLGMVLLYVFALKLKWLPSYGIDGIKNLVMPIITLAIPPAAQTMRFTKSSMLESIRQDYVRTARAKGAAEGRVIWKHALKNALLPVVTQVGMNLGMLIAGAVVVERLFSLPGIGGLIVDRIAYKDEPVIIAGTVLISIAFTLVMLLVDVIYAFIDPRIHAKYTRTER